MGRKRSDQTGKAEKTTMTIETKTNTDNQTPKDVALTPEQLAVVRRARAESAEWTPISEGDMHDYSLAIHPLSIKRNFPEAYMQQMEKRYAFRWCERTDKRIDELTRSGHPVTRWKLCTSTTTPWLQKYIDPMWGCVTRLDQVLLFRPWDRHMIEKQAKEGYKAAQANSGKPENIALKRAQEGIDAKSGPEFAIKGGDVVDYEDSRVDVGDLVVDE